uniref:Uncharacterized protein n=1 Tax=Trichuris muris TaxID=70415 RepID=A0A5S6QFU5_TRIMR
MPYQGGDNYEFVEFKNNAYVLSKMFGTLDGRYKFRINFSGRNRRFELVLSGMADSILERKKPDYFPPRRLWLLWIPNERQFRMTDLIIKCVVQINEMCFPFPPPVMRIPIPEGPRDESSSLDIGAHANGLASNHHPQGCLLHDDIPANVPKGDLHPTQVWLLDTEIPMNETAGPCLQPSR